MTPEQRIVAACIESGVDDLISPGILRNLVRSIEEACSVALRERDARLLKLAAEWDEHAESVWNEEPHTAQDFTRCAKDLRALLEEAGK